jgi:beta-lactamase regulating signal transducer with metallopeptidase domain
MRDVLNLLLTATWVLSAAVLLLALLRRPLLRLGGASTRYLAWLLVPAAPFAALLGQWLPVRPDVWQVVLPEGEPSGVLAVAQAVQGALAPPPLGLPMETGLVLVWALGASFLIAGLLAGQRTAAGVGDAALVGVWRPRVRLPADFRRRFGATQRRLVLLHERVHAERGDTRWLLLAWTLLVLQWFNPLAWWALARLREDMELACDAEVLRRRPDQLMPYRAALLAAAPTGRGALLATPCARHPLVERIAMLPQHRPLPARRALVALAALTASALVYAAQQAPAPAPPPMQEGYSKLRLDLQVGVNGQMQEPTLMLHTFNDSQWLPVAGTNLMVLVSGRPHRDPQIANGEEVLMLSFEIRSATSKEALAKPRIATKDGVPARIEHGEEGKQVLRIDVLPRIVRARLHDGAGALAELKRDIEAGKAPAVSVKP